MKPFISKKMAQLVKNSPANAGNLRCEFDPWVRKNPLPGDSHGQRSLAGYSLQGCIESDMTEATWQACMCLLSIFSILCQPPEMGMIRAKFQGKNIHNKSLGFSLPQPPMFGQYNRQDKSSLDFAEIKNLVTLATVETGIFVPHLSTLGVG